MTMCMLNEVAGFIVTQILFKFLCLYQTKPSLLSLSSPSSTTLHKSSSTIAVAMSSSSTRNNDNNNNKNDKIRKEKDQDDNNDGPLKKKAKQASSSPPGKQSNLLQFFAKATTTTTNNNNNTKKVGGNNSKTIVEAEAKAEEISSQQQQQQQQQQKDHSQKKQSKETKSKTDTDVPMPDAKKKKVDDDNDENKQKKQEKGKAKVAADERDGGDGSNSSSSLVVPDPIIPHEVKQMGKWKVVENCMLVRLPSVREEPRTKVAAFDVDGTLLVWRISGWPSKFEHYEVWMSSLFDKLRNLHDTEGYKLVLFSNQGAIRGAFTGKKATFVKSLLEWLVYKIDRPVHIVLSTNKKLGYHKPNPGMWKICQQYCNKGIEFDIEQSFFVGDSVMNDDDPQGGVDEQFAQNIGKANGKTLRFYPPQDYFGPSDSTKRQKLGAMSDYVGPPTSVLATRNALLGGYLRGPLVLVLCGVQGSGKSTFCKQLFVKQDDFGDVSNSDSEDERQSQQQQGHPWVHVSQDTINKGKPGKRELVEEACRQALKRGRSVVVDRTHLEPDQRKYFVTIAKQFKVPVHVLVLQPSKEIISNRVRNRTNHAGGVEGEKGVRVAMMAYAKMVLPNYKNDEGFDLISRVTTDDGVKRMSTLYRQVVHSGGGGSSSSGSSIATTVSTSVKLSCGTKMPMKVLGTMKVGRRIGEDVVKRALKMGWKAIDTAPTYKNEDVVGKGLTAANREDGAFVICKIPKRAIQPEQVREELYGSLDKLGIRKCNLLLLHWPCDVIEAGTLKSVWEAMEKCVEKEKCQALGVCNFSVGALQQLLLHCKIPPAVNQVERHPLLPQTELLEFCSNQGIVLQAHTPLGQGKLLSNDTVVKVAKNAKVTPAQAVLLWNLQHGVSCVPKCATEEHQKEIMDIGGKKARLLTAQQMKMLDEIKEKERFVSPPFMQAPGKVYSWKK